MPDKKILLGFSVPEGEPVYLPLHHLAIFGITQLSGKTTTLEALISRSGLKAIAFIVKRGESGFTKYNLIVPYYKPRANWQFVEGLVNVALGEKVKYEPGMRWAIIKVSKGAKDLREVKARAEEMLEKAKRDFQKQLFEKLITYLEIVVPELERWRFSDKLELSEGINVMDLSEMRIETQHLVIAGAIEYVFQNLDHVVVIIPEAWETMPQNKMTPVKWVAQQFIRKGAAIGNYLWLDSQDIGSIDKAPLRQCDNWLMGRMKEAHEVERILKQLLGMKVPAEEIQTLPLGHFYAAIGNEVKKTYVLPVGVPEEVGRKVALGQLTPEWVRDQYLKPKVMEGDDLMYKEKWLEEKRKREELEREFTRQVERLSDLKAEEKIKKLETELANVKFLSQKDSEQVQQLLAEKNELLERIDKLEKDLSQYKAEHEAIENLRKLLVPMAVGFEPAASMPSEISVAIQQPTLTIQKSTPPLSLDDSSLEGKIAIVYAEGELPKDKWFSVSDVTRAFQRHGWKQDPRTSSALDKFCQWGYFVKQMSGKRPDYRLKLTPEQAREKGLLKEVERK
jgi:hypothetical protein